MDALHPAHYRCLLLRHTLSLLRETHQQFLSAPVGIPLESRFDAVVFYLPLFHLVGGGISQVARYRLHGLIDTKEMGTDRTSAEICLQGVGPLTDLIALDAHDPRDAAVQTGNDRSEERRVGKECVSTCRSRW